jgi:hypothetical protein
MIIYEPKNIDSLNHLSHNGNIKYYLNNTFYSRILKCECNNPLCNRFIEDCNSITVKGNINHLTGNLINLKNLPLYAQDEIHFDAQGNLVTVDCI